jgi:hypothetical protein
VNGDAAVGGPSYPLSYRIFASLVVLGLLAGAWHTRQALLGMGWSDGGLAMGCAAAALVLLGWGHLLGSRTVLRAEAVEHGWLWTERIEWREVTQAQLLHWPALAWLVAPRLLLRAGSRGRRRIPLADPQALQRVRERLQAGWAD